MTTIEYSGWVANYMECRRRNIRRILRNMKGKQYLRIHQSTSTGKQYLIIDETSPRRYEMEFLIHSKNTLEGESHWIIDSEQDTAIMAAKIVPFNITSERACISETIFDSVIEECPNLHPFMHYYFKYIPGRPSVGSMKFKNTEFQAIQKDVLTPLPFDPDMAIDYADSLSSSEYTKAKNLISEGLHYLERARNATQDFGKTFHIILNEAADCDLYAYLSDRARRRNDPNICISTEEFSSLYRQGIAGLAFMHRIGYAHMDAHMGNFFVTMNPDLDEDMYPNTNEVDVEAPFNAENAREETLPTPPSNCAPEYPIANIDIKVDGKKSSIPVHRALVRLSDFDTACKLSDKTALREKVPILHRSLENLEKRIRQKEKRLFSTKLPKEDLSAGELGFFISQITEESLMKTAPGYDLYLFTRHMESLALQLFENMDAVTLIEDMRKVRITSLEYLLGIRQTMSL